MIRLFRGPPCSTRGQVPAVLKPLTLETTIREFFDSAVVVGVLDGWRECAR
jgi:hypothetical protein